MLIIVSPAKSLDFDSKVDKIPYTTPRFIDDSRKLVDALKSYSPEDISELMEISNALGKLNQERFANWRTPFSLKNAKQAMFAFTGDVYLGLRPENFSKADINFAQKHLRILSGLYGVLRPLDLMQPYRVFQDYKNGQYKIISFYAKKARGEMAAYVIKNKIKTASKLTSFDSSGYKYCAKSSTSGKPVFKRKTTP